MKSSVPTGSSKNGGKHSFPELGGVEVKPLWQSVDSMFVETFGLFVEAKRVHYVNTMGIRIEQGNSHT